MRVLVRLCVYKRAYLNSLKTLSPRRDSLLLGWEDFANSRLLYLEGSIVVPYRKRYVKKIQVRLRHVFVCDF